MSGKSAEPVSYALIVCEGVHDVAAVQKILRLWKYKDVGHMDQLPSFARDMVPKAYPTDADGRLSHLVSHPSFSRKDDIYTAVANANGIDKLGSALRSLIAAAQEETLSGLRSVAVLADMDNSEADKRKQYIAGLLSDAFADVDYIETESFLSEQEIRVDGRPVPARLYLFPVNQSHGTLEALLLEGEESISPDLCREARTYLGNVQNIQDAQTKMPKYTLSKSYGDKAAVGVISNVLKPGFANQASIRDSKGHWFTTEGLTALPRQKAFADFLRTVLQDASN